MDAAGGDGLGDDAVAADLGPGEDDLGAGGLVLLGDLGDGGVVDEEGEVEAVVAKGRVGGDVDVLLLAEGDELVVLQQARVALDLVGGGDDAGGLDDGLDVLDGEVGDADVAGLGLGEGDHGLPGVDEGHAGVEGDLVLLGGVLGEEGGADLALQGEGDGPVDEVQVEVVELQLGEGVVEGLGDDVGVVGVVPQLGGDEEVLALEAKLLDALVQALGDLLLVLVDLGQVEVPVAGLERLVDADRDLTRLGLPCSVAECSVFVGEGRCQSRSELPLPSLRNEKKRKRSKTMAQGRMKKRGGGGGVSGGFFLRDLLAGLQLGLVSEAHVVCSNRNREVVLNNAAVVYSQNAMNR